MLEKPLWAGVHEEETVSHHLCCVWNMWPLNLATGQQTVTIKVFCWNRYAAAAYVVFFFLLPPQIEFLYENKEIVSLALISL